MIALGLFKDQADIDNSPRQDFGNYLPGDIKYKDVNGDGIVNWDDIVPLKYSYVPQIQYGFATEFNWKNFNVSVLFEGVSRVTYFKGGNMYQPFSGSTVGNVITDFANPANRWISREISGDPATENPNAKYPRLYYGGSSNNSQSSSFWLSDGSYLRLKNVTLGYTLPAAWSKKAAMSSVRFFVSGQNLLTLTRYTGLDPEISGSGNDNNVYPVARNITFGASVSF